MAFAYATGVTAVGHETNATKAPYFTPALTRYQTPAAQIASGLVTYLPELKRFARSIAANLSMADDLVQETCRRALEASARFMPGTDLRAWLFCILHNLHVDGVRRCNREILTPGNNEKLPARASEERPIWEHLTEADVHAALESLPTVYAETYTLFAVDHLPYTEIARRLGIPPGTVGTRLRRARQRLRRILLRRLTATHAGC